MSKTITPNGKVEATGTDKKNHSRLVDLSCSRSWSSQPEAVECEMSEVRLSSCELNAATSSIQALFGVCSRILVDLQVIGRAVVNVHVVMIGLVQAIA